MDMHSELLKKIYDLPAIIQGALGSFVFAILAFLGRIDIYTFQRLVRAAEVEVCRAAMS
jgi:hypothetical protein